MKISKEEQQAAQDTLDSSLTEGRNVFFNITGVAKSGMSRTMEVYVIEGDDLRRITHYFARAGGYKLTDKGIRISGCGMDMRFALLADVSKRPNSLRICSV